MNDEIKEILDKYLNSLISYPFQRKDKEYILDCITNLQQENERLKRIKDHYLRYRNNDEKQQEVYNILELGKDEKNLHHHKNTGGLNWIDLPMTKFSSISSYIRARDLALIDYKSRVEKAIEYINKHTDKLKTIRVPKIDFNYNNLLNILQRGKDEQ